MRFFYENISISISISLKFVSTGSINNIPALVQILSWQRPGHKLLSEPMMLSLLTHICVTRPQWITYCDLGLLTPVIARLGMKEVGAYNKCHRPWSRNHTDHPDFHHWRSVGWLRIFFFLCSTDLPFPRDPHISAWLTYSFSTRSSLSQLFPSYPYKIDLPLPEKVYQQPALDEIPACSS